MPDGGGGSWRWLLSLILLALWCCVLLAGAYLCLPLHVGHLPPAFCPTCTLVSALSRLIQRGFGSEWFMVGCCDRQTMADIRDHVGSRTACTCTLSSCWTSAHLYTFRCLSVSLLVLGPRSSLPYATCRATFCAAAAGGTPTARRARGRRTLTHGGRRAAAHVGATAARAARARPRTTRDRRKAGPGLWDGRSIVP